MDSKHRAADFLDPENFNTGWPGDTGEYASKQYQQGIDLVKDFTEINISVNDTWSASNPEKRSSLNAYEKIGYHAGTASLLTGMLDSGLPIFVHRWTDKIRRYRLDKNNQCAVEVSRD